MLLLLRYDKTQEEKTTFFTYDFLFYQEENSVSEFFHLLNAFSAPALFRDYQRKSEGNTLESGLSRQRHIVTNHQINTKEIKLK